MFQIYSEHEWLYPDMPMNRMRSDRVYLHAPRGGSICCQILTDDTLDAITPVTVKISGGYIKTQIYQMLPATVDYNSAADILITKDYESVKHFVTRKAPFDVYDATRLIDDNQLAPGRVALFVRFDVPLDANVGVNDVNIRLDYAGCAVEFLAQIEVHKAAVPALSDAKFGMINWLMVPRMDIAHKLKRTDPIREKILDAYIADQIDTRNTDLMLPAGEPVYDENGKVIDFDFTEAELVGNKALKAGFRHVLGGFIACNISGKTDIVLDWDNSIQVTSFEGYRQLHIYFTAEKNSVEKCGWGDKFQQCLVDEPGNADYYRVLSTICRKHLPGIIIHDPIEFDGAYGGMDIWCVKQALLEEKWDDFEKLQAWGDDIWVYTCGFPAGNMMNRAMDLPLTATRLPFWMSVKYGCKGFLHWGYNAYPDTPFEKACQHTKPEDPDFGMPPGNSHIVYPGCLAPIKVDGPVTSIRSHLHRMGCEDAEMLIKLMEADPEKTQQFIATIARTFTDYETDPIKMDEARIALIEAVDALTD